MLNCSKGLLFKRKLTIPALISFGVLLFFCGHQLSPHSRLPTVVLEKSPRPIVPLTSLGPEADESYRLGSLSLPEYRASLESFIHLAFPSHLRVQLTDSLNLFLSPDLTAPRPERPKVIWQTNDVQFSNTQTRSWSLLNENHEYRFLNDDDADNWIRRTFKGTPIEWVWDFLPHPVMKADLLRYLLLLVEGGVYTDVDTTCLKPISHWGFHPQYRGQVTQGFPDAIVGIEADVGDRDDWHKWWSRPIQIVQWTMAFTPGHPVLLDTVRRVYAHSREWAFRMRRPPRLHDVLNMTSETTGPAVFTDAMLRFSFIESNLIWPDLRNVKQPLRTGSVTFLPVTGFSPGVGNFGAEETDHPQAMVYHKFRGSWKPKKHE